MRRGTEIEIIRLRARHLHPTQKDFRVAGLDGKAAGWLHRPGFHCVRRLVLSSIHLFFGRHIFQDTVIAAIDDEHAAFLIDRNAIREIDLPLCFPSVPK